MAEREEHDGGLVVQHFRPHPEGTHIGLHPDLPVPPGTDPDRTVVVHDPDLHGVPHKLVERRDV